jgi:hypothetical protein
MTAQLKVAKEIECKVFKPPPCLISFKARLTCRLSIQGHCHGSEDRLKASPDCGLDAIQLFSCVTQRMIARAFFMDQAFEAYQTQKFLEALA